MMKMLNWKRFFLVVAGFLALSLMFGCAGLEKAPKDRMPGYVAYPTALVQADRDLDAARVAGKDRECPTEFNAAKAMNDKAYEVYMTCRTEDAIDMARKSSEMTKALCPSTPVSKPVVMPVTPMPKPVPIVIKDINFDFDMATLTGVAVNILRQDIRVLKDNPGIKIRIEGNTCAHGEEDYNMRLGERRAAAVKEYLVNEGGISEARMSTISYGETRLLMPEIPTPNNKESVEAKANRRVHFEIVGR